MAPTASNSKYMIVFMDELSGYPEIVASPTATTADVVNAFFEKILEIWLSFNTDRQRVRFHL